MTRAEAMELFAAIAHGDQEHREWLREALRNFADGKPVPPPRGKGTDEHATAHNLAARMGGRFVLHPTHNPSKGD